MKGFLSFAVPFAWGWTVVNTVQTLWAHNLVGSIVGGVLFVILTLLMLRQVAVGSSKGSSR